MITLIDMKTIKQFKNKENDLLKKQNNTPNDYFILHILLIIVFCNQYF